MNAASFSIRLACWNACRIALSHVQLIGDLLATQSIDLVLLQEPGVAQPDHYIPTDYLLIRGDCHLSPSFLIHKRCHHVTRYTAFRRFWSILVVSLQGITVAFISTHLPDHGSMRKLGVNLRAMLGELNGDLDSVWCSSPWSVLVFGGDLNTALGSTTSVCGRYHEDRHQDISDFTAKWGLAWSDCPKPTHVHYTTKVERTLDYVYLSSVAGFCLNHSTDVRPSETHASDHHMLITDLSVRAPGFRRRHRAPPPTRLPGPTVICKNTFAALMEEAWDPGIDEPTVEQFSSSLLCAAKVAASSAVLPAKARITVRELLQEELAAVDVAVDGEARLAALRTVSRKRRRIVRSRMIVNFKSAALKLPRDDRPRKSGAPTCLQVNGVLSERVSDWEIEFRLLYRGLLEDPFNSQDSQQARLDRLRLACGGSGRLEIPSWLIRECIARCRTKAKSSPGIDGITWNMLTSLPPSSVEVLRRLLESRLNNEPGFEDSVQEWCDILITLIPKVNNAVTVHQWRPISLTSVVQKLFLSICSRMLTEFGRPIHPGQYGFVPGKQTMEVSECLRLVLQKCDTWGLPVYILKIDAFRAFDSMWHDVIESALLSSDVHPRLIHAIMRELSFGTASLKLGDIVWDRVFSYSKGGRQGGTDTPELWKRYLDLAITRATVLWQSAHRGLILPDGAGVPGGEVRLDFLAWADDIFLISGSLADLKSMWLELSTCINDIGLKWKPGSLEVLSNRHRAGGLSLDWEGDAGKYVVLVKPSIISLGVCLDSTGGSEASIQFRIAEGRRHFFARESVLCKRSIPLFLRWRRLEQTVWKTFLHGAGGWRLTQRLCDLIVCFENSILRRTLCMHAHDGEDAADFRHRVNSRMKFLKESYGYVSLVDVVKNYHLGWCGHVARLGNTSHLLKVLSWRPDPEIRASACPNRVLRVRRGPTICFDSTVASHIGIDWRMYAANRQQWGALARNALHSWGAKICPIATYSEKVLRFSSGRRCPWNLTVLFLSSWPSLGSAINGGQPHWLSLQTPMVQLAVRLAQWNVHLFQRSGIQIGRAHV